mgnify:CR=1 FL=1
MDIALLRKNSEFILSIKSHDGAFIDVVGGAQIVDFIDDFSAVCSNARAKMLKCAISGSVQIMTRKRVKGAFGVDLYQAGREIYLAPSEIMGMYNRLLTLRGKILLNT